jgi:hypothetical protein
MGLFGKNGFFIQALSWIAIYSGGGFNFMAFNVAVHFVLPGRI